MRVTLPADRLRIVWTILLLAMSISPLLPISTAAYSSPDSSNPSITPTSKAINWLADHQQPDGSYGAYSEIQTPAAAYALWANYSRSNRALSSFRWLAGELDNSSSGIWGQFAEADILGEILYTLWLSNNLGLLHNSSDYQGILSLQQPSGGFKGFFDTNGQQVESSVDTAMALLGLINANKISSTSKQSGINYLVKLQNPDGTFNLTRTIASNQFSALGPEPISITALVTLVLHDASYNSGDLVVSRALSFLGRAASGNFTGHIYGAALSALAFNSYGRASDASRAISFMISRQNSDGGFADSARSSAASNPLDTGWAVIALQRIQLQPLPTGLLPLLFGHLPNLLFAAGVLALIVTVAAVLYYTRRRSALRTLEIPGP